MDWDSTIKAVGVPQAIVVCVALAVGKWALGQALTWLGERIDKLCSFLAPHVHELLTAMAELLRLRAREIRFRLDGLERSREEAPKGY